MLMPIEGPSDVDPRFDPNVEKTVTATYGSNAPLSA